MNIPILVVCIHNSARSQMAEAFINRAGHQLRAESAGLEPGTINPLVVEVMREKGIDLAGKPTQSVFELFKASRMFRYVITVCDGAAAERCPIFPGTCDRIHMGFPDPSKLEGSHSDTLAGCRRIRDQIETWAIDWTAGIIAKHGL